MQVKDGTPAQKNTRRVFVMEVNVHKFLTVSLEFHTTSLCTMCVDTEKYVKTQRAILHTQSSPQTVKQWTRHILNKRHISDVAELALVC